METLLLPEINRALGDSTDSRGSSIDYPEHSDYYNDDDDWVDDVLVIEPNKKVVMVMNNSDITEIDMPDSVEHLHISGCDNLTDLPTVFPNLVTLELSDCRLLSNFKYWHLPELTSLKFSNIGVYELPLDAPKLRHVHITRAINLTSLHLAKYPELQSLFLSNSYTEQVTSAPNDTTISNCNYLYEFTTRLNQENASSGSLLLSNLFRLHTTLYTDVSNVSVLNTCCDGIFHTSSTAPTSILVDRNPYMRFITINAAERRGVIRAYDCPELLYIPDYSNTYCKHERCPKLENIIPVTKFIQYWYRHQRLGNKLLKVAKDITPIWWHPECKGGYFWKKQMLSDLSDRC